MRRLPMDKDKNCLLLFGVHAVLEKLRASPEEVREILLARERQRPVMRVVREEARARGITVRYFGSEILDRLAEGQNHQGVLARIDSYAYVPFSELLRELAGFPEPSWVLLLDGLTDPRNLGALLRSAEATRVHHVVIPKDRNVGVTPTVVKTSAGAVHHLKISRVPNLRRAIQDLKETGYWIVGLDSESQKDFRSEAYPGRVGVVVGGEGSGIRPLIKKECDHLVSIPMKGVTASLNVSVAGAVFFYELLRQQSSVCPKKGSRS